MKKYKVIFSGIIFLCAFLMIGCNNNAKMDTQQNPKNTDGQYLQIENYNFIGDRHLLTFKKAPDKILVSGKNAIDTIIALGCSNKIHTAIVPGISNSAYYKKKLPLAEIYAYPIAQEAVIVMKPDFILGQRRYFDDKVFGDTVFWDQYDIPAYIQEASGPIPSLGKFPPCTIESEKSFIINIGKILHREEAANQIVSDIDNELNKEQIQEKNKPNVLFVEFFVNDIEVFGENLLSGDIVKNLGGEIVDYGYPFISTETLVKSDADVIFVVYNGGDDVKDVALNKMKQEIFKNIKAVANGKIYPIPYDMIVATGANTPKAIKIIREGMCTNFGN